MNRLLEESRSQDVGKAQQKKLYGEIFTKRLFLTTLQDMTVQVRDFPSAVFRARE